MKALDDDWGPGPGELAEPAIEKRTGAFRPTAQILFQRRNGLLTKDCCVPEIGEAGGLGREAARVLSTTSGVKGWIEGHRDILP